MIDKKYTELRFEDDIDVGERYVAALMVLSDYMDLEVEEVHETITELLEVIEIDLQVYESEINKEGRKYH